MSLVDLIIWLITLYGTVNIIAFSAIMAPVRNWISYKDGKVDDKGRFSGTLRTNFVSKFLTKLMYCPMCLGFWIAIAISLMWKSPTNGVYLLDAFCGSGASWIIYLALIKLQTFKS